MKKTRSAAAKKTMKVSMARKAKSPSPRKVAAKKAPKAKSKLNMDLTEPATTMHHGMAEQPKMRISRKKPGSYQQEQSRLSQPDHSVNPAARR